MAALTLPNRPFSILTEIFLNKKFREKTLCKNVRFFIPRLFNNITCGDKVTGGISRESKGKIH